MKIATIHEMEALVDQYNIDLLPEEAAMTVGEMCDIEDVIILDYPNHPIFCC